MVNVLTYDPFNKAESGVAAINQIPLRLGKWQGKDIPLEERIYELLETRSIIHRAYTSPNGGNIFLSIVYYSETSVDFHAPEACLGGKGIRINKSRKTLALKTDAGNINLNLNQLIWKNSRNERLVYYFYKAGDFVGNSYLKLRLNLALNKFANTNKSGALIRISTPIASDIQNSAAPALRKFIEGLYPYIIKAL